MEKKQIKENNGSQNEITKSPMEPEKNIEF